MKIFFQRVSEHPQLPVLMALLAMLLVSPSLQLGWLIDDYVHRAFLTSPEGLEEFGRSPADIFAFIGDGWPEHPDSLPWWADDDLTLAFFRPLAGLSHWLDHQLWPDNAFLMHFHSLLWFGLVAYAGTVLFRRLTDTELGKGAPGAAVAVLAALLFAVDETHGTPASWIANRNALMALAFGVLTLIAHHRWRRDGWRPGAWLAPFLLLLGVLSAEAAVACGAYLLAYALCLDRGSLGQRLMALVPCAAVGLVWRLAYSAGGYGANHSSVYIDPGADPLRFAATAAERGPILLWSQLGFPPTADLAVLISDSANLVAWWIAVLGLIALGVWVYPLLRHQALARFWALGMVLAVVPPCGTYPMQRLLGFTSLGGAGLLALLLVDVWQKTPRRRLEMGLTIPLVLVHLVMAPLVLATTTGSLERLKKLFEYSASTLPGDPAVAQQRVVVVSAPTFFLTGYMPLQKSYLGETLPGGLSTLATGIYGMEIHRPDPETLVIRPEGGYLMPRGTAPPGRDAAPFHFPYLFQLMDSMYHQRRTFTVGERLDRPGFSVEILGVTEDGRPIEVAFRFMESLESPSLRWMRWQGFGLIDWRLPAVGETVTVPALHWQL